MNFVFVVRFVVDFHDFHDQNFDNFDNFVVVRVRVRRIGIDVVVDGVVVDGVGCECCCTGGVMSESRVPTVRR